MYLVNNEPSPYQFAFVEKSCHCDGHTGQLVVSPMKGTVLPNEKYVYLNHQLLFYYNSNWYSF